MWSRTARADAERATDARLSADSARELRMFQQKLRLLEDEYSGLEEQETRLLAEIKQLSSSGQALQASMKKKEKKPLRQQMAEKRRERILLKRQILLLAPPQINDLPPNCLLHVLVNAVQSDDMLAHAAIASQVCRQWRRVIMNRDPYARALYDDPVGERPSGAELQLAIDEMMQADNKDLVETRVRGCRLLAKREERARILSAIRSQTKLDPAKQVIQSQMVELADIHLRDEGTRAVACALKALPRDALPGGIVLRNNGITESGFVALGEALGARHFSGGVDMHLLDLGKNPQAGDDGVQQFVAQAIVGFSRMSSGNHFVALSELCLDDVGCANKSMVALAETLPLLKNWAQLTTRPAILRCGGNPNVCEIGWKALAEALPNLLGLAELDLSGCYGMGDAGAVTLAEALTKHSLAGGGLNILAVDRCGIANEGGLAIAHVVQLTPSLLQLSARRNLIDERVQAAIRTAAKTMRLKLRLKEL